MNSRKTLKSPSRVYCDHFHACFRAITLLLVQRCIGGGQEGRLGVLEELFTGSGERLWYPDLGLEQVGMKRVTIEKYLRG